MKRLIAHMIVQGLLFGSALHSVETTSFQEAYIALDNCVPTLLDLKVHKLDCLLRAPRDFKGKVEYKFQSDEGVFFESLYACTLTVPSFGECKKELMGTRLVFSIYLPNHWENATTYHWDTATNKLVPQMQSHQIAKEIFDSVVKMAKEHIHESFAPRDAVVNIIAPTRDKKSNELIIIFENGIPYYQDAFFSCHDQDDMTAFGFEGS